MTDENQLLSIEDPFPGESPAPEPEPVTSLDVDEPEPEGIVEVSPGRRMVDVSVVAAERKKARENAEKGVRERELAPLKAKADALEQALETVKPHLARLHEMSQPKPQPQDPVSQVTDAEAEQEARDLQLYTKDSTLDIATAKKIIARRRMETDRAASSAAQQAIAPYVQDNAQQRMGQQFAMMVNELGADDILTKEELAQQFVELGPDLAQHPQVARVALERAVGQKYLQRKGRATQAPQREPVLSEAPGGRIAQDFTITERAGKMGLTKDDLKTSAKTFTPGGVSPIGSW